MIDLTVITATLPERIGLLTELAEAMLAQTVQPRWIVRTDFDRDGPVAVRNRLAETVQTGWLFVLDDDDLVDPDHFEVLGRWLTEPWDVIWTWPRIEGTDRLAPEAFQIPFDADAVRDRNYIPICAAVRTDLWRDLGGLRDVPLEDWDFWLRAIDAGARFAAVPAATWTVRLHDDWEHRNPTPAQAASCGR